MKSYLLLFQLINTGKLVTKSIDKFLYQRVRIGNNKRSLYGLCLTTFDAKQIS